MAIGVTQIRVADNKSTLFLIGPFSGYSFGQCGRYVAMQVH
jgi:hypothetical protein